MNNLTLSQKQFLFTKESTGKGVVTVVYDPTIVDGPSYEAAAVGANYTEYYREDTARLVEVIYYET